MCVNRPSKSTPDWSGTLGADRSDFREFLAGETLRGLANRHNLSRNLIRLWVQKYEAGAFDEDAAAADLRQQYEGRIAALERLVGKHALELEFRGSRAPSWAAALLTVKRRTKPWARSIETWFL
jgi:transposase